MHVDVWCMFVSVTTITTYFMNNIRNYLLQLLISTVGKNHSIGIVGSHKSWDGVNCLAVSSHNTELRTSVFRYRNELRKNGLEIFWR